MVTIPWRIVGLNHRLNFRTWTTLKCPFKWQQHETLLEKSKRTPGKVCYFSKTGRYKNSELKLGSLISPASKFTSLQPVTWLCNSLGTSHYQDFMRSSWERGKKDKLRIDVSFDLNIYAGNLKLLWLGETDDGVLLPSKNS